MIARRATPTQSWFHFLRGGVSGRAFPIAICCGGRGKLGARESEDGLRAAEDGRGRLRMAEGG